MDRRSFCSFLAASVAAPAVRAQAKPWPTKPVRLVVAFPPGGLADVLARHVQAPLSEALGQPVLIDNRSGAAGNVAANEVVSNGGDGHTLLVTASTTESVNPVMFPRTSFDIQRDLQPVALLANTQLFLIVRPTLAVNNLKEFLVYARANPGKLSYGSAGSGTTPHLAGELFKHSAKLFATHVPYRGAAPAIHDVMAGQVDFAFAPGTVFPMASQGKVKVLAVASRQRSASAPAVPTFGEAGVEGVYADTLFGVYAPASMPADVVERLNRELNAVLARPAVKARFTELGADAVPLPPRDYKQLVREETALFRGIVRERNIRPD